MLTRRQFLEDSILAAVAAPAGPALVASAAEESKEIDVAGPVDPLRPRFHFIIPKGIN